MNKEEPIYYEIKKMSVNNLYDALLIELSAYKFIELYKLMKNKMETLEDEPVMTVGICQEANNE